jgi:type II secretory ATPase GspE/PulE/Tfp pilus assembly ATPase PilB-like protein
MGVAPFLVAYTTNIIIGQRLVRKICPFCSKEYHLDDSAAKELSRLFKPDRMKELFTTQIPDDKKTAADDLTFFQGTGCNRCGDTGYKGRVGIYEVLEITDDIIKKINERASANEIKDIATANGMLSMFEDGLLKARLGITTISEVLRVTKE